MFFSLFKSSNLFQICLRRAESTDQHDLQEEFVREDVAAVEQDVAQDWAEQEQLFDESRAILSVVHGPQLHSLHLLEPLRAQLLRQVEHGNIGKGQIYQIGTAAPDSWRKFQVQWHR